MSRETHEIKQKIAIAERRARVTELYLQRKSQSEIAAIVGVTQQTVSLDLKAVQKRWLESATFDFNTAVQRELAEIDMLEREYYQSWNASKVEKIVKTSEQNDTTKPRGKKTVLASAKTKRGVKAEQREGDPRYLQGVQWCIAKRCELLGLTQSGVTINNNTFEIEWPTPIPRTDSGSPAEIGSGLVIDHTPALPAPIEDK